MDYEQLYKNALEKAKKLYGKYCIDNVLEDLFPELKESEDERIRKGLIKAVSGTLEGNTLYNTDVTREEALAWLEKQGGKSPSIIWHNINEEPEEMRELLCEWESNDATWHEVAFYHSDNETFWNGKRQVENVIRWCYIDDWLEMQGEQVNCPQNLQVPNGGIVLEDFNGGEGNFKINLTFINKKQVEEIENIVDGWNTTKKQWKDK